MTDRDDEMATPNAPQKRRSTDPESATQAHTLDPSDRGVVQDSPGNPQVGSTDDLSGTGNLGETETNMGKSDND